MATLPIPGLLAEIVVLGLQAVDFGAQLIHFRAQVVHRGGQLREEVTGKTDLDQLAIRDQLGLPEIAPSNRDWFSFIENRRTGKNGIGEGLPIPVGFGWRFLDDRSVRAAFSL